MLRKNAKLIKVDVEVWAEEECEDRDILSRINPISLGGGQYVSDIRITPGHRFLYFNIQSRFSRV